MKRIIESGSILLIVILLVSCTCCINPSKNSVDAIAVWQHYDNGWDVWYSIWDESKQRWWTPQDTAHFISKMEGDDYDPNIEFGPRDSAIAVWSNQATEDIYFSKWDSIRLEWSKERVIDEVEGLDIDPDIAYNRDGKAICVWVNIRDNIRKILYSVYDGRNWSKAKTLSDKPKNPSLPEVSFRSEYGFNAEALWIDEDKLFYSRFTGVWSDPVEIGGGDGDTENFTILRCGISEYGTVKHVWSYENGIYYSRDSSPELIGKIKMPECDNNSKDQLMVVYINDDDLWSSFEGDNFSSKFAADSGSDDHRPAVTFLESDRALAVWWSDKHDKEIFYSKWNGKWSDAKPVVPEYLEGEDRNPEISSPRRSLLPPTTTPIEEGPVPPTTTPAPPVTTPPVTTSPPTSPPVTTPPVTTTPPKEKSILTPISSTFTVSEKIVEIKILVGEYIEGSNRIYDLEIFPGLQNPEWKNVEIIDPPPEWSSEKIGNGIRVYGNEPIPINKEIRFRIRVDGEIGDQILIHATNKDHENMGLIISEHVKPDLTVKFIMDPPVPLVGSAVHFSIIITNEGGAEVKEPFKVSLTVNGIELYLSTFNEGLEPGESTVISFDWVWEWIGEFQIKATVDTENAIEESNEENNTYEITVNNNFTAPDLTITKVYLSKEEIYEGDSAMIYIEVSNTGKTDASGFTVKLYIGENVYESGVIALGPGKKMNVTYYYTFPLAGVYTFTAEVDPWNAVHESDEENNIKTFEIIVKKRPLPDLVPSYLKVYYTIVTGEVTQMYLDKADVTVKNFGYDSPQDKYIELAFFLDDPDNIIATYIYHGYLKSGEQFSYTHNFNKWPISYGQHTLGVIVDYRDIIPESNEKNNINRVVFPE